MKERWGTANTSNALMSYRFPRWMFCPRCRHLRSWKVKDKVNDRGVPICTNSACNKRTMVPMRFVAACNKGHLQDVPWDFWAHMNQRGKCSSPKNHLYFVSKPNAGSGLEALEIQCRNPECGSKNSLKEIMKEKALRISCSDKQPWEFEENNSRDCDEPLQVLQRGASNLYYPIIRSALDIPVSSHRNGNPIISAIADTDDYNDLLKAISAGKDKRAACIADEIAEEFGFKSDDVLAAVENNEEASREFKIPKDEDLRLAEWDVLASADIADNSSDTFQAKVAKWKGENTLGCESIIERVVLLDKLREVRAFCGFERVKPDDNVVVMKDSRTKYSWLPACEVYGEGIFIQFDQNEIERWEFDNAVFVHPRVSEVEKRWSQSVSTYLPEPTAKFLVLHTFAHLIIRQLSFESGYSSGSLRERIYANNGQAGVLIYTADGDSEGSLGGLVKQGEANRLIPAIIAALETASWCSNDPVCSESESQGVMGLNKAACHSCSLVSETSCETNNLMLDRKLLIGDDVHQGLFTNILQSLSEGHY
jgi:hypothetical protein